MTNEEHWNSNLLYYVITSIVVVCNLIPILRAFLRSTTSFVGLLFVPVKHTIEEEEQERGGEVTFRDIGVVLQRLGMAGIWKEGGDGGMLMEGVHELLTEKTASLEELEEAFYVFDRNEDGFISREELWSVMRRLGLRTVSLEDCGKMIRVYDDDGDGKISFYELRKLLEAAV